MIARLRACAALLLLAAGPLLAQAPPQAWFEPREVWLEPGQRLTLALRVTPAGALGQVWVRGPDQADLAWTRQQERVQLEARAVGTWTLEALRGPGGPVLARARVHVRAGLLERVLERVRAEASDGDGRDPLVVFDLDDTLFDTRWRTRATLQAFGQARGEPRLSALELEDVRWELGATLRAAGLTQAEVQGPLGQAAGAYRWAHFHDYHLDRPFPGAVEFVRAVGAAGGKVVYVTGRDEARRAASEAALRTAGFPVEGALRYFEPPGASGPTAAWKGRVVRWLLPARGEVVACFDNEPANCNAFVWAAPDAIQVFLDTLRPPASPQLASGVEPLAGWE